MEKIFKRLKVIVIFILVLLICLIAFLGTFKKKNGIWANIVPEYKYGMDIEGTRELKYTLDDSENEKYVYVNEEGNIAGEVWKDGNPVTDEEKTEEENAESEVSQEDETSQYNKETRTIKVNSDDKLTKENFEKSKKIIKKRLESQDIESYNIRLDEITGKFAIETNNNDENVSKIESLIGQTGKFEIVDYQNGLILMDNSDIKSVSAVASNNEAYQAYLQIKFNKKGAQKLKDISNKYVEIEKEENDEATETEEDSNEESTTNYVCVVLDGTKILTTYFGEEMSNGILQITIGDSTTDYKEFYKSLQSARTIADVLNTGVLPITYKLETDNFVKSSITTNKQNVALIIFAVAVLAVSILLIVKYKLKGLFGAILAVGFIAVLSLVSRYTNVIITLNSLIAYTIIIVLNYIFTNMLLKNMNQENGFWDSMKKFYLNTILIDVVALVFIFTKFTIINSVGMVAFWGMILIALYNIVFSKAILKK